jgi:hypothetical protein
MEIMDGFIPCWNVKRCTILVAHTKTPPILKAIVVKRNNMNAKTIAILFLAFHQYQNFHVKPIFGSSIKLIMIVISENDVHLSSDINFHAIV